MPSAPFSIGGQPEARSEAKELRSSLTGDA